MKLNNVYCFIRRLAYGADHQGYKLHDYEREMVSHVPFSLDLNTFLKDKRMSISQFILCVLTFFMRFRLPVQNAFPNSCQHSTTELGQKGYLSMIFQILFKKKYIFLDIIEQFGTRTRRRNPII